MQGHGTAHGDNLQNLWLWDMKPECGGAPRKISIPAVDAKEHVARDPHRYVHHFDGDDEAIAVLHDHGVELAAK